MQYALNLEAARWKAEKLNQILPELQEQFEAALSKGKVLELNAGAGEIIAELVGEAESESRAR